MRARWWMASMASAVILVACDGGAAPDETPNPTDPATTEPTDATPSPSVDASQPAEVDVSGFVGSYTGTWTNTTFDSTGPVTMDIQADADAGTFAVVIDLDGSVFGAGDPEPFTFEGGFTADGGATSGSSPVLGSFTFTIDGQGEWQLNAPDVPDTRVAAFTVSGTAQGGAVNATYAVIFEAGGGADGTFVAQRD